MYVLALAPIALKSHVIAVLKGLKAGALLTHCCYTSCRVYWPNQVSDCAAQPPSNGACHRDGWVLTLSDDAAACTRPGSNTPQL